MNNVLILLDNLDDWKPYYETSSVLTVSDYLKNKPVEKDRKLVINLSNDYSYNSEGYYCSLLAQTRGQKVIPDVDIINKMEAGTGVRMDRSLQALCYQWIQKKKARHIQEMINNPELSFKEIAGYFDFSTSSHFTAYCQRMFGMSPSELRKKNRDKWIKK